MNQLKIDVPKDGVADFCQQHHIRKLALFGSVLREDFRAESDVDVLVEFEPGHVPGFVRLANMEFGLGRLLGGRKVVIGQNADDPAVDLLGIGRMLVIGTEPGLHVADRHPAVESSQGRSHGSRGISLDQNEVR